MITSYLTLAAPGAAEIEVKRSRFLGRVERADDEEQARAVLDRVRKERWDARHHCSAFVLGPDRRLQRSSDDGEPAGTAGAPMLEVLRGHEVSDVVAVVTRYFGGVLLGAGGLVRAYSDAARAALGDARLVTRRQVERYDVPVPHADAGKVENELRARDISVLGADYAERVTLHVAVTVGEGARLEEVLAELTGGLVAATAAGRVWVDD